MSAQTPNKDASGVCVCVVVTTIDSEAAAHDLARAVVAQGLAACAQIAPIRSIYHWRGQIEESAEWRLELKAARADYQRLEAAIRARHPYQTPEIVSFDVAAGFSPYMQWVLRAGRDQEGV